MLLMSGFLGICDCDFFSFIWVHIKVVLGHNQPFQTANLSCRKLRLKLFYSYFLFYKLTQIAEVNDLTIKTLIYFLLHVFFCLDVVVPRPAAFPVWSLLCFHEWRADHHRCPP